jgi:hypothetical protein
LIPFLWDGWIFARLDLVSVALATLGVVLVWRKSDRTGGVFIALASMAKAWAITLMPGLLAVGRRRATEWAAGALAVMGAVWFAVGGVDGVRQVVTFRDARGWQIESTFGGLVLLLTGDKPRGESGAWRIGVQPGWTKPALAIALVVVVFLSWWLVRRVHDAIDEAFFYGSIASVLATLVLAPIISPQYVVWVLPFVAVLWRDRMLVVMTTLAMLGTAIVAHWYTSFRHGELWLVLLLNGRNLLLWAITGIALVRLVPALEAPARARSAVRPAVPRL